MTLITFLVRARRALTAVALLLPLWASAAYPEKPIHFIVPYVPGGGTDITARLIGQVLSEALEVPVVIENRPGANTVIGSQALARAQPDGYTIGLITNAHSINRVSGRELPYDSERDFAPISRLITSPFVLVAHPSLQVQTVRELVELAKQRKDMLTYASPGEGSPHQLATEWLANLAGVEMLPVQYKGVAPALLDVAAGRVDFMFTGVSSGMPYVEDGRLVALAVSPADGVPTASNIATVAASGFPEYDFSSWYGIAAPSNTPQDVIVRLSGEIATILGDREVQAKLIQAGVFPAHLGPVEFTQFLLEDAQLYEKVLDQSK